MPGGRDVRCENVRAAQRASDAGQPIYIGGKPHFGAQETAFDGRIAGLVVSHYAMNSGQVQCFYQRGQQALPLVLDQVSSTSTIDD